LHNHRKLDDRTSKAARKIVKNRFGTMDTLTKPEY